MGKYANWAKFCTSGFLNFLIPFYIQKNLAFLNDLDEIRHNDFCIWGIALKTVIDGHGIILCWSEKVLCVYILLWIDSNCLIVFLKKIRVNPTLDNAHHTVTLSLTYKVASLGFLPIQLCTFCLLTLPDRWKCTSSIKETIVSRGKVSHTIIQFWKSCANSSCTRNIL